MEEYLTAFLVVALFGVIAFALRKTYRHFEPRLPKNFQTERWNPERTLPRVFFYKGSGEGVNDDTGWYAYYYPGGQHRAYGVGPCKSFDEATNILCTLTGCENVCTLAPYLNAPMPHSYRRPVELTVEKFRRTRYTPEVPFVTAMAQWGGRHIHQFGPGG
ncbi:MAG: hypothetical protein AAB727_00610 [Patescibacteria group bacterium]